MSTTSFHAIESGDETDFPKLEALYRLGAECGEEWIDVYVWATGRAVECDYGVPRSPVWTEIEDIEIESYEINGVEYTHKSLTEKFGKELADDLHEICADLAAERDDWE